MSPAVGAFADPRSQEVVVGHEVLKHQVDRTVVDLERQEADFTAINSSPADLLRETARIDSKRRELQVESVDEGRTSWGPDTLEALQGVLTAKQALVGLCMHCAAALGLGFYSLVQVGLGDRPLTAWFVVFSALATGSTACLLFLKVQQPRGQHQLVQGACVAVLPLAVFTVQLLAHLTCEVDLQVGEGDVAALAVAVMHLAGSLVTNADCVASWAPLPLVLGLVLIAAHAAGKFLAAQALDREVPTDVLHLRLLGPPLALLAVAIMGHLLWRAQERLLDVVRKDQVQQRHMGKLLHRLSTENLRLEESVQFEHSKSMLDPKGNFKSAYDRIVTEVEELRQSLRQNGDLDPDDMRQVDEVIDKLKKTLASDGLFKVQGPVSPKRRTRRALTDSMSSSRISERFAPLDWSSLCGLAADNLPIRVTNRRVSGRKGHMLRSLLDIFDMSEEETAYKSAGTNMTLPGEIADPAGCDSTGSTPVGKSLTTKSTASTAYGGLDSFDDCEVGLTGELNEQLSFSHRTDDAKNPHLSEWVFDAYFFDRLTSGHALLQAGTHHGRTLLQEVGIVGTESRQEKALNVFLTGIEKRYRPVPYHNAVHAADVLNSMMFFIRQHAQTNLLRPFTAVHKFAAYVASVIHDVGHFGVNNRFHVMQHHAIAVLYNDSSPLENMHCAIGFLILRQPAAASFLQRPREEAPEVTAGDATTNSAYLTDEQFTDFRRVVIEAVLTTDMAKHFEATSRFRASIGYDEATGAACPSAAIHDEPDIEHAAKAVGILLKAADLGHSAKPLAITREQTRRIHQEFFGQGDKERQLGLPISPLCDRESTNMPKSQVSFLQHLVLPFYKVVHAYLPADLVRDNCIHQLKVNMEWWQGLADANS